MLPCLSPNINFKVKVYTEYVLIIQRAVHADYYVASDA